MSGRTSSCFSLHHKSHKELLTYGFIRDFYLKYVPSDIINKCCQFVHGSCWFSLNGDLFRQFVNNQYEMGPPQFKINDCLFQFKVFIENNKSIEFMIFLLSTKEPLIVTINYHLFNKETGIEWRELIQLKSNQHDYEFKNDNNDNNGYCGAAGWMNNCMQLNDIKHDKLNQLNFKCDIKLIHIRYKNGNHFISDIPTSVKSKNYQFEWILDKNIIESLQNYKPKQLIYSNEFNVWSLSFCPNGINRDSNGACILFLDLMKLPYGVGGIAITIKVVSQFMSKGIISDKIDESIYNNLRFDYGNTSNNISYQMDESLINDDLKEFKTIKWSITIDIQYVGDDKLNEIDCSKWSQYNII